MATNFKYDYISALCLELSTVLKAGIPVNEGLGLLVDGEKDKGRKQVLMGMYDFVSDGGKLSDAIEKAEVFPGYMTGMIAVGEETGELDRVLESLSQYYDRRFSMNNNIKDAIIWPSLVFFVMIAVTGVIITRVLPIFERVFSQLGATLSPMAQAFLDFGMVLNEGQWVILGIVAILVVLGLVFAFSEKLRAPIVKSLNSKFSRTKLGLAIGRASFSSAMAMTLKSGLDLTHSLDMVVRLCAGTEIGERAEKCRTLSEEGTALATSVEQAELLEPLSVRMLSIGVRAGSADIVMEEIARRLSEEAELRISKTAGRIEPIMVVVMSLLVALVLLSVMLPLMGIMGTIG